MIFRDLLLSVDIDNVVKKYKDMFCMNDDSKIYGHYRMLCNIQPSFDENAQSKECLIEYMPLFTPDTCLGVENFGSDSLAHMLAEEIIIDDQVKESDEEIVAFLLWHTSYYGWTEEERAKNLSK